MPASAPIALFVYNRPRHTRETVAALQLNPQAADSDLWVFSDGPKTPADESAVNEVRAFIREIGGFRSVTVVEQPTNQGLARSIIGGVTQLCREHGRVIVVEDDIVVSPHFLRYMNEALDFYEAEERVMHISAYMFPINPKRLPETFFYRVTSCWGWATWQRAWQHYQRDIAALDQAMTPALRHRFNLDGSCGDFWNQVEGNRSGQFDTWAIFWYATVFLRDGLCLHPARSLVRNIGNDGSGINSGASQHFDTEVASAPVTRFSRELAEHPIVLRRMKAYYRRHMKPGLLRRVLGRIRKQFGGTA
ncbi:MAG: glycosyltransferase [Methylococcaceae bacterium]|nr:glycosyltransferase [Methylococcaceae bacterium]